MFKTLKQSFKRDRDFPERQFNNHVLSAVLNGKIYDNLQYEFFEEVSLAGEHVPLHRRRPNTTGGIALAKVVVDDSVSMLFSEGHFPAAFCEDETTRETLAAIIKESRINELMINAAIKGSVGSVAVQLSVLKNRLHFEAMSTEFLTPTWDPEEPDTLLKVRERYKVVGRDLIEAGYNLDKPNLMYWFTREWDKLEHRYFLPYLVSDTEAKEVIDEKLTVKHGMGFVPMVWIKNLPGGDKVDGSCTFEAAIQTLIEMDYQMSQAGRGLRYSSDPMLVIKEPGDESGEIIKGGGHALIVGSEGDAKLLEINGNAAKTVVDYVKALREMALESIHGNRANAEKMGAATSGKAMELMNQSLVWRADKLRITYGEGGLLNLLNMIRQVSQVFALKVNGKPIGKLNTELPLTLRWPAWYDNTANDRQAESVALMNLVETGVMSVETAVGSIAAEYDIEDVPAEVARLKQQKQDAADLAVKTAQSMPKANQVSPASKPTP